MRFLRLFLQYRTWGNGMRHALARAWRRVRARDLPVSPTLKRKP